MKKFILCAHLLLLSFTPLLRAKIVEKESPVMILGGGVGALTSAVYLSRAGITPVVITGPQVGGTITQSHNVQNWPGEISISGTELGEKVRHQAEMNGAILESEVIISVDFSKRPYLITTKKVIDSSEQLIRYKTQAVIIALGATPNFLGVPGETGNEGYWSKGVYNCAVCDGSFYKDKVVTVVGGGDAALIEAEYLSNIASKVHILVRKDEFRSVEKLRMKEILESPKVEVHYKTVVKEIKGNKEKVTHLVLQDSETSHTWDHPTDALFLAIGSRPNTELFCDQIDLDPAGYIVLKKNQQTSVEGVYAIGDVADPEFKQAVSAAGDAAKAALQLQKFLASYIARSKKEESLAKIEKKAEAKKSIEIYSKQQFKKELSSATGAVFVDFYSTHCSPCRMFSPLYEEWSRIYGDKIKFLKVNADHAQEIFKEYQIQVVPTLVILDAKGNIVRKSSGFNEISEVDKRLGEKKGKTELMPYDFK